MFTKIKTLNESYVAVRKEKLDDFNLNAVAFPVI